MALSNLLSASGLGQLMEGLIASIQGPAETQAVDIRDFLEKIQIPAHVPIPQGTPPEKEAELRAKARKGAAASTIALRKQHRGTQPHATGTMARSPEDTAYLLRQRLKAAGAHKLAARIKDPSSSAAAPSAHAKHPTWTGGHGDIHTHAHKMSQRALELGGHKLGEKPKASDFTPEAAKEVAKAHRDAHDALMVSAKDHMSKGEHSNARSMQQLALQHAAHGEHFDKIGKKASHERGLAAMRKNAPSYHAASASPSGAGPEVLVKRRRAAESADPTGMRRLMGLTEYPTLSEAAPTLAELERAEADIADWRAKQRNLMGLGSPYPTLSEARNDTAGAVYSQLSDDFPKDKLAWVQSLPWHGPQRVLLDDIDFSNRANWQATKEPERVKFFAGRVQEGHEKPIVLVKPSNHKKWTCVDGHHRLLAYEHANKAPLAYQTKVPTHNGPWLEMHASQRSGPSFQDESVQTPDHELEEDGILARVKNIIKKGAPTPSNIITKFKAGAGQFAQASKGDVGGAVKGMLGTHFGGDDQDEALVPQSKEKLLTKRSVKMPKGEAVQAEAERDIPVSVQKQARAIEKGGPVAKRAGGAKSKAGIAYAIAWKHHCKKNPESRHCRKTEDAAADAALAKLQKIRGPEGPNAQQQAGKSVLAKLGKKYGESRKQEDAHTDMALAALHKMRGPEGPTKVQKDAKGALAKLAAKYGKESRERP